MISPPPALPRTHRLFPAVLLGAALCGAPASLGADEPHTKWDHRCIDAPRPEDLEPVLNHWGEDGWELAAAVPTGGARGVDSRLCFKRARPGNGNGPRVCRPTCGEGTYCLDGKCVPCVPTCRADESCAPSGICMARQGGATGNGAGPTDAVQWQPTREELNAARAVLQPTADRCAVAAREEGQVVVSMTILGSGTVTAAKAKQSTLSEKTQRCVEDAARTLRFRPFRAALIAVDMPVSVHGRPAPPSKLND